MKRILAGIMAVVLVFCAAIGLAQPTYADCGGVETSVIDCDDGAEEQGGGIFAILLIVLNVLTFGIGIAGTLGIIIAGIMYLTARDDQGQMVKAKNMLINIVLGLVAYAVMWAFLQWLLPGGIIGN
ncbi:hypothetical protein IKW75_03610 [Candidatus Saccharibacteria bacterium]|nr:hypothetical protein [Candidatus Saccharibacteria bacterium]